MEALLITGLLGLRGLAVMGEHGGVELEGSEEGRPRGDCGHCGLTLAVTGSPFMICFKFAFNTCCVSDSLNHLRNNSSTFSLSTGFIAMFVM